MRNTIILIITMVLIALCIKSILASCSLHCEYREDAFDYEKEKKKFIRTSASINTENTHINAAVIKNNHEHISATWAFMVNSNYIGVTCGHYYFHNGMGLLLGKPSVYSPDPSVIPLHTFATNNIILCKSGNPTLAMYGGVLSLYDNKKEPTLLVNIGVSYQERFIKNDYGENGIYPYSLNGLMLHDIREKSFTEPVNIITYFISSTLHIFKYITINGCYYHTGIFYQNNVLIFDTYNNNNTGIKNFSGYSLYTKYEDKIISIFSEYCISVKHMKKNNYEYNQYNYAYISGFMVKKKFYKLTFIIQKDEKGYYTPFSNTFGNNSPKSIYYYSIQLRPYNCVKFSWSYFDQNYLIPSSYYSETPHKRVHSLKLSLKIQNIMLFSDCRFSLLYKDSFEHTTSRYQQGISWKISKNVSINAKAGLYTNNNAWYNSAGFKWGFSNVTHDIQITYISTKKETVYLNIIPLEQSNILSESITAKSVYLATRLNYSNQYVKMSIRVVYAFIIKHYIFEGMVTGIF